MNNNQQLKALNYTTIFLSNEIGDIKETLQTVNDPLTRSLLEKRLKEIESDYYMFMEIMEKSN